MFDYILLSERVDLRQPKSLPPFVFMFSYFNIFLYFVFFRKRSSGSAELSACTTFNNLYRGQLDAPCGAERHDPRLHDWLRYRNPRRLQTGPGCQAALFHHKKPTYVFHDFSSYVSLHLLTR